MFTFSIVKMITYCNITISLHESVKIITIHIFSQTLSSRMIAAVPMKGLIVMIDGRLSRDHEAIRLEPQKKGIQEPQIVMVIYI